MTPAFHLADKDYIVFKDLIQNRTGLRIGDTRRTVLARALQEGAAQAKCHGLDAYLAHLMRTDTDSDLWDHLVKKLTIGESYFFRHLEQIQALRQNILPDLIARHWTDHTLYLWSAGCATGEEPYTVAIILRELLPDIERWKIMILATDINRQALAVAEAGHYRDWSFRGTDAQFKQKYFSPKGDVLTINPAIRQMVTFAYLNLAEDKYPSTSNQTSHLDLILCRNVTIYLPPQIIKDIADRFHKCLKPGGWLMVAPSETNLEIYSEFQTLVFYGTMVYQKLGHLPVAHRHHPAEQILTKQQKPMAVFSLPDTSRKTQMPAPQLKPSPVPAPVAPAVAKSRKDKHSEKTAVNLFAQGDAHMKERRYDEARECFQAHLATKPDSVFTRYRLACLEANAGHLDDARHWAEQAIKNDPMHIKLHYTMGIIHQAQGKLEEAIIWLKKAIYLDPDFILAHFSISHIYERTGKHKEATRHRTLAARLACQLPPDELLPGSDDLTAGQLLGMVQASKEVSNASV